MFGLFGSKKYNEMSATAFAEALKSNKDVVLLDVRSAGEFSSGHIKSAKNIDVQSASFQANVQKLDKTKQYLVYCRSGMRSGSACSTMASLGFTNLVNLKGGIMSWTSSGFPVQ